MKSTKNFSSEKGLEAEYIISLTILVLTFLTVDFLKELIEPLVAKTFLLLVSFHISLFNIGYVFRVMDFKIPVVQKFELIGRFTLVVVFMGFFYLFLHILCNELGLEKTKSLLIPIIVVAVLGLLLAEKILKPYLTLRNVKIVVLPEKIDIYSRYEETEPLFIKIENKNKDKEIRVKIEITFPEEIMYTIEYDNIYDKKGKFSKEFSLDGLKAWNRNIILKHVGRNVGRDAINVKILVDNNLYEKDVDAVLWVS